MGLPDNAQPLERRFESVERGGSSRVSEEAEEVEVLRKEKGAYDGWGWPPIEREDSHCGKK